jgi:hypothetical protein
MVYGFHSSLDCNRGLDLDDDTITRHRDLLDGGLAIAVQL